MATIDPNIPNPNAQLNGILNSVPMPRVGATTLGDGTPFTLSPNNSLSLGGQPATPNYTISAGGQSTAPAGAIGGGLTVPLANGAQPPAPGTTLPATVPGDANTVTPAANTATTEEVSTAAAVSGFGKAERAKPMVATVGEGKFSFPSFKQSARSVKAPAITWGPGWTKVQKDGMWYMQHKDGSKAIPAVEFRITPVPADNVQTIKVANGWGKRFPDGTVVMFDRNEGAYKLDPKGNKSKLSLGVHTIGGVKVRIFEVSVVRTLEPNGHVHVFDSRGQSSKGTTRGRMAAALGAANAGASISGGGKTTAGGPADGSGGKLVSAGGPTDIVKDVDKLTGIARGILSEIRSGNVDPARLAELQAQLNTLPAGILQAAGAAGTMTTTGTTPPGTTVATTTTPPPGTTGGGGANPQAGVDANATSKTLAAGAKVKLDITVPTELVNKSARFAQLSEEVQAAIAKALGSDQGSAALKADQLVSFNAKGEVSLVEAGTVFTKYQKQIRGAGPGEDLALTVKPTRQPGGEPVTKSIDALSSTRPATTHGGGHTAHAYPAAAATAVGGGATGPGAIKLLRPGAEIQDVAFGPFEGSFTWKTLPKAAKAAVLNYLRTQKEDPAARAAFDSRTGTGWTFDPKAIIVISAGFASFVGGLSMTRAGAARPAAPGFTPPVAGGGPTTTPIGHDATRPPVTGGGGLTTVAPGTAPPVPAVGGNDGHNHTH